MVQPPRKTIWQLLIKLSMQLLIAHDPAIAPLNIYPEK